MGFWVVDNLCLTNRAAVNVCVRVFVWAMSADLFGKYLVAELLHGIESICLTFQSTVNLLPKVPEMFSFQSAMYEISGWSTFFSARDILGLSHTSGYAISRFNV